MVAKRARFELANVFAIIRTAVITKIEISDGAPIRGFGVRGFRREGPRSAGKP
jgi:hypothetical protein